ncbi:hypothetical protein CDAR_441851 [Caerostris darwini]|uniref:Uncharacterized protein n=1 Tax=Caerostris darwini TaxID=1538125 RepID=A0AAV4VZ42_9ARAC|nr:hypothetical protein CDAR_441851 [Caerostris darwini]
MTYPPSTTTKRKRKKKVSRKDCVMHPIISQRFQPPRIVGLQTGGCQLQQKADVFPPRAFISTLSTRHTRKKNERKMIMLGGLVLKEFGREHGRSEMWRCLNKINRSSSF